MGKVLQSIKREQRTINDALSHRLEKQPLMITIDNYTNKEQELKRTLGTRRGVYVDLGGGSTADKIEVSYKIRNAVHEALKKNGNMQKRLRRDIMRQLQVKDGLREGAALAYKAVMLGRYSMEESDETLIE